jgi:RNA polymerase sigma-70 factor (ECF subfamily)
VLVRRYLRPVQAVTAAILWDASDVEDAVQETFLRALNGLSGYQPERPFAPWLYQIARNTAKTRLTATARRRAEPLPVNELREPSPGPDVQAERAEIRRLVDRALRALPEQRRIAFRLHDVEGYETGEVARIMGLSAGTVRSHVHHARRALRAALAHVREEPNTEGGSVDATLES